MCDCPKQAGSSTKEFGDDQARLASNKQHVVICYSYEEKEARSHAIIDL